MEAQLYPGMVKSKVIDTHKFSTLHCMNDLMQDSFVLIKLGQGYLLDLEQLVFLVADFSDLVLEVGA